MNVDETILTAYALGELSGAERAEVAAHLVSNADARQYVAEVRATANVLADELARESFGGLSDLQHAAIEQKLEDAMRLPIAQARRAQYARRNRIIFAMSLAASILIVSGVVMLVFPFIYNHIQLAFLPAETQPKPGDMRFPMHGLEPIQKPSPINPFVAKPGTHNDQMTATHDPEIGPDEIESPWLLPLPDNRLVDGGSGREETAMPAPLIGITPPNDVKPIRPVPVVRGPDPVVDPKAQPAMPKTDNPPHSPGYRNADVPIDQPAPGKVPTKVESSANGMLPSGDQYSHLLENPFITTVNEPISGFSAGVDTASYSNIRRFLTHDKLPPHDAIRIEEMLNYFPVRGGDGPGDGAVALQVETGACPWLPEHRLVRVCLTARPLPSVARPPVNLVVLVDASESMRKEKSKLPMLKQALHLLASRLSPHDRIAILAYRQEPGVVLSSTSADDKQAIWNAIDRLEFGGQSTGGKGIEVAYQIATRNFISTGVNRVVLATDGNWNIGITNRDALASIAHDQAANHISLTVLGVGMENLKDATLQNLAAAGNGSYAYIDTLAEARKVLVDQVDGALISRARDIKVQMTFDPAGAGSYRLLGYERRKLSPDELKSHSRTGGELGAGQSVTALYEVIPAGKPSANHPVDMVTTTVTYSDPITQAARSLSVIGEDRATPVPRTSTEFRFAAAVAEFGLVLRDSDYKGNATYSTVLNHLEEATGPDETGYRREFLGLVRKAKFLATGR